MTEKEPRSYKEELAEMANRDQEMRRAEEEAGFDGSAWDHNVDVENTRRLKEIVNENGWPTISKVGIEGSHNAWLLIQHADHDVEFQEYCLKLMLEIPKEEIDPHDIAYLTDRIAVNKGQYQTYGTQFVQDDSGQYVPRPLSDPDKVNERRLKMGLNTLEENAKEMNS